MDDYQLLVDLHKRAERQGPGGGTETRKAIDLAMLDPSAPLKVADIGCGTGASTIQLARSLNAKITAIDFLPDFIEVLKGNAENQGLINRINPLVCSMENLQFDDEEYDVIWSEGAIYNIGFEKGINDWRRFLKPGGLLVVSEITWITSDRPFEIQKYWQAEYPEIDTASSKINILEKSGYSPVAYFVLPEHCWLENYYRPMQSSFTEFLARHSYSEKAQTIVDAENKEIALYEKYRAHYSYGVYVARKLG
ncbi:MAG: SAM-dependent methyltransferase [Deltaproteobacteria bacterium]|nr:MAG: SAM-dependent methyltransferase [Deltaproteobacteria bacterium]